MMYKVRVILLLGAIVLGQLASAQRHFVRNFSSKDGLSQSEVSSIAQDAQARLYLATGAIGIDVFDGISFEKISPKDGLHSPHVGHLHRDALDRIWSFSSRAVHLHLPDTIRAYAVPVQLKTIESVYDAVELGQDQFLIGTDHGLLYFNQGQFKLVTDSNHPEARFFGLCQRSDSSIMAVSDQGLFEFENQILKRSSLNDQLGQDPLLSITALNPEAVLIGGHGGYYAVTGNSVRFHRLFENEQYAVISLLKSSAGRIYAGTNGLGLFIIHPDGELEHLHEANGLSDDFIWTLFEDVEGHIILGTSGAGVDLLAADHFRVITRDDGLQSDIVYDIMERVPGELWIAQVNGGISIFKDGGLRQVTEADGLSHLSVRSMLAEPDTVWIGTERGLSIYTAGRFSDVSEQFQIGDFAIFDIHRDAEGTLWLTCKGERYYGESGGVIAIRDGHSKRYTVKEGLASENVYCITEPKPGVLWFGTTGGVSVWDGQQMNPLAVNGHPACYGTILAMEPDQRGAMWMGGVSGLAWYRDGEYRCLSGTAGLHAETTYLLQLQGDSILWVGSSAGLEKLDLKHYYDTGEIRSTFYNDNSGFYGSECNQNAVTFDANGDLWFGTIQAAVRYRPSDDKQADAASLLSITDVRLGGKQTAWRARDSRIDSKGLPEQLELAYFENSVQFEFIDVSLTRPTSKAYSFYLEGLETEWSDDVSERSVFYSNLKPGPYTFHVRSKDKDYPGVIGSQQFAFEIAPAYYQTYWFKLLIGLLLLALTAAFFYWRINSVRTRERELRDFNRQLAELEMRALRAQMNPHFLFNSLNSINHFIIKNKKEEASAYLTKFSRLVRMVLQNSTNKLVTLEQELLALRLYIQLEALRFKGDFEYKESIAPSVGLETFQIPPLLLQPYVENAIWHGLLHLHDSLGRLSIDITGDENHLIIVIEDNGIGREKAQALKSKSVVKDKSLGLKMNQERMGLSEQLYAAKVWVKINDLRNAQGAAAGTQVVINILYND